MADNESIVRALFAAMAAGDREGVRSVLNEDAVWTVMAQGIPAAGDHVGSKHIVEEFLGGGFKRFVEGGPRIIPDNIIVLGDQVAVEAHADAPLVNGQHYQNKFAWFFRIRNGKIATVHEYVDTRYAIEKFSAPAR